VRNIFLTLGSERFLVAGTTAEGNNDHLLPARHCHRTQRRKTKKSATRAHPNRGAQKISPARRNPICYFVRRVTDSCKWPAGRNISLLSAADAVEKFLRKLPIRLTFNRYQVENIQN
jgi:hypothetical protein